MHAQKLNINVNQHNSRLQTLLDTPVGFKFSVNMNMNMNMNMNRKMLMNTFASIINVCSLLSAMHWRIKIVTSL